MSTTVRPDSDLEIADAAETARAAVFDAENVLRAVGHGFVPMIDTTSTLNDITQPGSAARVALGGGDDSANGGGRQPKFLLQIWYDGNTTVPPAAIVRLTDLPDSVLVAHFDAFASALLRLRNFVDATRQEAKADAVGVDGIAADVDTRFSALLQPVEN